MSMKPNRPTLLPMPTRELHTSDWVALIRKWSRMGILVRA